MKFLISKEVRDKFPEVDQILLPVHGVKVEHGKKVLAEENLKDQLESFSKSGERFFDQQYFTSFRQFYQDLGLDPKAEPPSVESLYRRYQETGKFPQINNVVDTQNLVSMQALVPMGVFDIDKIKGDMVLRYSREGEEFRPLTGGVEHLPVGVMIIADEEKVLNVFPRIDSIYQKITKSTKNVLILGDVVRGISQKEVERAVKEAASEIQKHAGGKVGKIFLTEAEKEAIVSARIEKAPKKKKDYSILTGIVPSGGLHIGNFFGAVVPFLEMAKKAKKVYFFIADLHALTTLPSKGDLQYNIEDLVLSYLAFGIDPNQINFYRQSDVPQHTELQSILNNVIPLGLVKRCHAYKDRLQKGVDPEQISMGLFCYPILQAADILLYDPDYIPVGEDQRQHIELTRDIAESFNRTYGKTFKLPEVFIVKKTARLVGTDGERKMSKSLKNYISVFEDEAVIRKQIMSCFTDPKRIHATDPGRVEGNPVFIYHDLINEDKNKVEDLKRRYRVGKVGDVEVKKRLFIAFKKRFKKEREAYQRLKKNPEEIKRILKKGAEKARKQAVKKMMEVREKIGITNKYSFFKY
jgi:tryptophanyl-tRNA synthetase